MITTAMLTDDDGVRMTGETGFIRI